MSLKDKLMGVPAAPPKEKEPELPTASKAVSMADRIRQANKMKKVNPNMMILTGNDVALLLDDSGSMGYPDGDPATKLEHLNEGVDLFSNEIDFNSSKVVAVPMNEPVQEFHSHAEMKAYKVDRNKLGGTPMDDCIRKFNGLVDVQQGILISDGEANNSQMAIDQARLSVEHSKRIDCIHIGTSASGENTLKQIAEVTGGMFFKFKDMTSFQASLSQLAPAKRKALANKSAAEIKMLTGATEVIK